MKRRSVCGALAVGSLAVAGLFPAIGVASAAAPSAPIATAQPAVIVPVPDGTCGQTFNPSTGSAHAHWDVTCSNGEVTIAGYVKHDVGSGCAYVKADFNGQITDTSKQSCGDLGGPTVNFSWTHPGSIADAYLTKT